MHLRKVAARVRDRLLFAYGFKDTEPWPQFAQSLQIPREGTGAFWMIMGNNMELTGRDWSAAWLRPRTLSLSLNPSLTLTLSLSLPLTLSLTLTRHGCDRRRSASRSTRCKVRVNPHPHPHPHPNPDPNPTPNPDPSPTPTPTPDPALCKRAATSGRGT